jgi:BirA family biotin operon repressor/biotin-[acetyl-CoA-carboxylase] ligase
LPPLDVDAIRRATEGLTIGRDLRYFPSVDSTNRIAADLPAGTWDTGTVVLADFQQAGRGRSGRSWLAPPGTSVLASVLFQPRAAIPAGDYIMLASLAVLDAVRQSAGIQPRLKWPNDVLIHGRKVAGILGEHAGSGTDERVILGIGINVTSGSAGGDELPETATTLERETSGPVSRENVTIGLLQALDLWYRVVTHQADGVHRAWAGALDTVGRPVLVQDSTGTWTGTAIGARRDGGLVVRDGGGRTRTVYAADVSIRDAKGFTTR